MSLVCLCAATKNLSFAGEVSYSKYNDNYWTSGWGMARNSNLYVGVQAVFKF